MSGIGNSKQLSYEFFQSNFALLLDSADEIKSILVLQNELGEANEILISSIFHMFCHSLEEVLEQSLFYMKNEQ